MLGMKKVGSGNIDDVNRVTPAHLLDAFKDLDAVLYSVLLSCFFPVVRACCEFVARYLRNRKGNRASGGSQTSQANPERHGCPNGSVCSSRSTPSFILPRGAGEEREPAPDFDPGWGLERLNALNVLNHSSYFRACSSWSRIGLYLVAPPCRRGPGRKLPLLSLLSSSRSLM